MNLIMNDLKYTDERMKLRGECFRALQHHLEEHCREVYEFCHEWIIRGQNNIDEIEIEFLEYVLDKRDYNIDVLERSYNL
jgi:hypothetical protein